MRPPATDVAEFLQSKGLGSRRAGSGWNISVSREPDSPVLAITVYDTGGAEPDTGELDIFRPNFQVRVRANDYEEGYAKIWAIMLALIQSPAVTLGGARYAYFAAETDILPIGKDEKGKDVFTCNFRALRQ